MQLTAKRKGTGLQIKVFEGKDSGAQYLVLRTGRDSFHVFAEVEAKEAAHDCRGSVQRGATQALWKALWKEAENSN